MWYLVHMYSMIACWNEIWHDLQFLYFFVYPFDVNDKSNGQRGRQKVLPLLETKWQRLSVMYISCIICTVHIYRAAVKTTLTKASNIWTVCMNYGVLPHLNIFFFHLTICKVYFFVNFVYFLSYKYCKYSQLVPDRSARLVLSCFNSRLSRTL